MQIETRSLAGEKCKFLNKAEVDRLYFTYLHESNVTQFVEENKIGIMPRNSITNPTPKKVGSSNHNGRDEDDDRATIRVGRQFQVVCQQHQERSVYIFCLGGNTKIFSYRYK